MNRQWMIAGSLTLGIVIGSIPNIARGQDAQIEDFSAWKLKVLEQLNEQKYAVEKAQSAADKAGSDYAYRAAQFKNADEDYEHFKERHKLSWFKHPIASFKRAVKNLKSDFKESRLAKRRKKVDDNLAQLEQREIRELKLVEARSRWGLSLADKSNRKSKREVEREASDAERTRKKLAELNLKKARIEADQTELARYQAERIKITNEQSRKSNLLSSAREQMQFASNSGTAALRMENKLKTYQATDQEIRNALSDLENPDFAKHRIEGMAYVDDLLQRQKETAVDVVELGNAINGVSPELAPQAYAVNNENARNPADRGPLAPALGVGDGNRALRAGSTRPSSP